MPDKCAPYHVWISADLDGELATAEAKALAEHIDGCAGCRAHAAALRAVRQRLRTSDMAVTAPAGLAAQIRTQVASKRKPVWSTPAWLDGLLPSGWPSFSLPIATGAACAAAWAMVVVFTPDLAAQRVSDHMQSLKTQHLTDVAFSDRATLKPWFHDRLTYAPPVLSGQDVGCRLMGGRIADIAHQKTAALAYSCGAHIVTVYVEPSTKGIVAPSAVTHDGYTQVAWRGPNLACQAVSDLNARDLMRLAHFIQNHARDA